MKYEKKIVLKDGRECTLRNGTASDGEAALRIFILTHEQTDFLASNAGESAFTVEEESRFLQNMADSEREIEIIAEVDGVAVGLAGIETVRKSAKIRHRAEFGISIDKAYWGLGLGRAMTEACIECARAAGYLQLELDVVAENERALSLYRSKGFVEYGRNPRGFRKHSGTWQELVLMRLELRD